ncbi:uncharacterized protein LOC128200391 [Galleria mellonella]|uniref:Uncharacterized protein LOC128200391 n=1 Tax=Galleria mellonella TaxID=7137 RepID=A0ABM3ME32_GALME|nr:uncharacterized protein LOC128200391 [Galleria mellonella]
MSIKCGACGSNILTIDYMECCTCKELYDLQCLNLTPENFLGLSQEFKNKWVCPSCVCSIPKGDNTSTPVRCSTTNSYNACATTENITFSRGNRLKTKNDISPAGDCNISTLLKEIRCLRKEVLDLKDQNLSIMQLHQDVKDLKAELSAMSMNITSKLTEYNKKLEANDLEMSHLKASLTEVQQKLAVQEQNNIINDIEIVGIPENDNENLQHITITTMRKFGVEISDTDLDHVFRAGYRRLDASSTAAKNKISRPIVVKLLRRRKRMELLKAAKARRNTTTENIVDGPPKTIYINERLTYSNRQLFRQARSRAQCCGFQYCWIRDGSIFIRKANGAPAIHIRCFEDLDLRMETSGMQVQYTESKLK